MRKVTLSHSSRCEGATLPHLDPVCAPSHLVGKLIIALCICVFLCLVITKSSTRLVREDLHSSSSGEIEIIIVAKKVKKKTGQSRKIKNYVKNL